MHCKNSIQLPKRILNLCNRFITFQKKLNCVISERSYKHAVCLTFDHDQLCQKKVPKQSWRLKRLYSCQKCIGTY